MRNGILNVANVKVLPMPMLPIVNWKSALASVVALVTLLTAYSAFAEEGPSVALPPFVLTGRVVDYGGEGLKSA